MTYSTRPYGFAGLPMRATGAYAPGRSEAAITIGAATNQLLNPGVLHSIIVELETVTPSTDTVVFYDVAAGRLVGATPFAGLTPVLTFRPTANGGTYSVPIHLRFDFGMACNATLATADVVVVYASQPHKTFRHSP